MYEDKGLYSLCTTITLRMRLHIESVLGIVCLELCGGGDARSLGARVASFFRGHPTVGSGNYLMSSSIIVILIRLLDSKFPFLVSHGKGLTVLLRIGIAEHLPTGFRIVVGKRRWLA